MALPSVAYCPIGDTSFIIFPVSSQIGRNCSFSWPDMLNMPKKTQKTPINWTSSLLSNKKPGFHQAASFLHASAHLKHASAQCWQWSWSCFLHSFPHASQTVAQTEASAEANGVFRDKACSKKLQMSAHSRSSLMHSAIILTSSSRRHASKQ